MFSDMRRLGAVFMLACVFSASSSGQMVVGEGAPGRVLSADLCADAFVIAMAQRERVIAASWQVDQPVSGAPDWARDLPRAWTEAERLLVLGPDLAVFGPAGPGRAGPILETADIETVTLAWGEDFDIVRTNARTLGDALFAPESADALIADLDARLAGLEERSRARSVRPTVFYLNVSGGTAGSGTLVDAAIAAAGGRNAAAEAGAVGWTPADPEWALRVTPDLIVTSYFRDGYNSINQTGARHALFRDLLERTPHIDVPSANWSCAGPALIHAAETIADVLDEIVAGGS